MTRAVVLLLLLTSPALAEPRAVKVGSKKFTESVILGELACHLLTDAGARAVHRDQLGGTQVLWNALLAGEIDLYPEYTGTLLKDVVKDAPDLEAALAAHGVRLGRSLGFSNSYGLGMKAETADRLEIRTISDLRAHPGLRYGFSEEFRKRNDGWGPLQRVYGLNVPESRVQVLDHDLAYHGLAGGDLDVIDVYTTEGEIRQYGVTVLADDRRFFPRYDAVWVYRADFPEALLGPVRRVEGRISPEDMRTMNRTALQAPGEESRIAADFLSDRLGVKVTPREESLAERVLRRTREHLSLVVLSLGAAVVVALPLGVVAARRPLLGQGILAYVGLLQTIPSLALLVFLIPLWGIGKTPAIIALFLYSLLPIVRNTHAGLVGIPGPLREAAAALGLTPAAVLLRIELPMAARSILAGIKTAAVINVGTATLGALIGAGGYGQPILSGIRLKDTDLILEGAVPAAVMALAVQLGFELAERLLTPRGLRSRPAT